MKKQNCFHFLLIIFTRYLIVRVRHWKKRKADKQVCIVVLVFFSCKNFSFSASKTMTVNLTLKIGFWTFFCRLFPFHSCVFFLLSSLALEDSLWIFLPVLWAQKHLLICMHKKLLRYNCFNQITRHTCDFHLPEGLFKK